MDLEGVPLHSLCLLSPPLRMVSAALWKVMEQRDVAQYSRLEEFITSLRHSVPGLLAVRHYAKLALGLRSRLILELCRGPEAPDSKVIHSHLDRLLALMQSAASKTRRDRKVEMAVSHFQNLVLALLEDPKEREIFFQKDFPEQYGPQFDKALEKIMWEFLVRLDQLLPVPDLAQTLSWFASTPVGDTAKPRLLKNLLQHEMRLGHKGSAAASLLTTAGDVILSSLSLPPSGRLLQETRQQGSGHTTSSGSTGAGAGPSPPSSRQRRGRRAGSPIAPVIGSISLQDIRSAGRGARVEEEEEEKEGRRRSSRRTWVTSRNNDEEEEDTAGAATTAAHTFTQIKLRPRLAKGAPTAAKEEEDDDDTPSPVQTEDEPPGATSLEAKVPRTRGRTRMSSGLQGLELQKCPKKGKEAEGDGMGHDEGWGAVRVTRRSKPREEPDRSFNLLPLQNWQPRVDLHRLDLVEAMRSRKNTDLDWFMGSDDSGTPASSGRANIDTDASANDPDIDVNTSLEKDDVMSANVAQERDNVTAAERLCSRRQLKVVAQRLDLSSPAVQALLNPSPSATSKGMSTRVSAEKGRNMALRKRKRRDSSSSPERKLQGSQNTENFEKAQILSPRIKMPGDHSAHTSDVNKEIVLDSEDELPSNSSKLLHGYCWTRHNTLVPTLEEFQ